MIEATANAEALDPKDTKSFSPRPSHTSCFNLFPVM